MTKHVSITEAQNQLTELVAAAVRGEEVILTGMPPVRLVPVTSMTLEQALAAEKAMTPEEIETRGAKRRAGIGMYEHPGQPSDYSFEPSMTDEELEERWNRKFGPAA